MPSITITELDETTPGSVIESTDVVFIPGFVNIAQSDLRDSTGKFIGLEANKPHLFTNLAEFISLCGDEAPTFSADQPYSDLGFDAAAYQSDNTSAVFIKEGSPDPAYVMAKELLAAGLPVLYQRVNTDVPSNDAVTYEKVETSSLYYTQPKADHKYFYKVTENSTDTYVAYGSEVDYPDFYSFINTLKSSLVYELRPLADVLGNVSVTDHYGEGKSFYVIQDKDGYKVVEDPGTAETAYKFGEFVVVSGTLSGKPVCGFLNGVINQETYELPEDAQYYYASLINTEPQDWASTYSTYYKRLIDSEGAFLDTFEKITKPSTKVIHCYKPNNVYKEASGTHEVSAKIMYDALINIFSASDVCGLIDRGNYSVKYLTSGGYPVFERGQVAANMLTLAKKRGDCVALIDHTDFPERQLNPYLAGSLYQAVESKKAKDLIDGEFGAMFTPWATYTRSTTDSTFVANDSTRKINSDSTFRAPGSYAYLLALADSIKTNANWLAIAGVTRGSVRNLSNMDVVIPNGVADAMQYRDNISINAITNIKPYGPTIWGNRTLKDNAENFNLVATSFLNIRNLVSDVKKTCYRVARKLTFEQDTDVLWINFKSEISKLLDQMKSGYGISGYKIVRDHSHPRTNDKATICAKIVIYPVEAVEDFYITVVLKDDEVAVN